MRLLTAISAAAMMAPALAVGTDLTADDADIINYSDQARGIVKEFAVTLKGELQAAIQSGGPVNAVAVCKVRAPAIAATLSEQSGWEVGRTSLKMRNAALNAPDAWEKGVLERFDELHAAGTDAASLTYAEVVEDQDGKSFRYMKAIPTEAICLACHGSSITPDLAATLDAAYPDDQARGYAVGDVRGAFTLTKPL